jgi:hypothetical protein
MAKIWGCLAFRLIHILYASNAALRLLLYMMNSDSDDILAHPVVLIRQIMCPFLAVSV